MIDVLFLTNIPSPYRVEFFNELGKHCNLTVLFECKSAKDRDQKWIHTTFNAFKAHFLSGISIGNDSAFSIDVLKFLKPKKYDIIVVGGYSTPTGMLAINYMRFKKIPFILNVDGGMIKTDSKLSYFLKKFLISSASCWLSSSDETSKYLVYYGANENHIYKYPFTSIKDSDIVNSPICKEVKREIRKEMNIKEEHIVLAVGRFISIKGFETLIKSAYLINDSVGIYIIGGRITDEYSKIINSLGLKHIYCIDFLGKEELAKFYKMSDLFVLPTRGDVWGLVVNEAMAYGLPIITTDKCGSGLELIVDWDNGFIVPVDDEEILANKISIALNDKILLKEMSINNLNKIRKYTIENMAKEHMVIFSEFMLKLKNENSTTYYR